MAQTDTLEGIKGGGGSIKVGTIGTISSLMTRELEQQNSPAPHKQVLVTESRGPILAYPCLKMIHATLGARCYLLLLSPY